MEQSENKKIFMVSGSIMEGADKKVDYKALFQQFILSKWYVYVLFFAMAIAGVYLFLRSVEPQYEIKSRVLIREEDKEMPYDEDMLRRSLNFSAVSENVFNEMYVLNSFSSFREIVEEMHLNVSYYWQQHLSKRQGYEDFPVMVDTFALNNTLGEKASFDFNIRPISNTSFEFIQDSLIGQYRFGQLFSNKYGVFRIKTNDNVPLENESDLHIGFSDVNAVAQAYMENLQVEFIDKNATVLELTLKDAIPQRGVDVMMKLIQKYREQKLKEKNEIALNTLKFIDERLATIGGELHHVESTIEQYKIRNSIAAEPTSDLGLVMGDVNRLNNAQNELRVQLKVLESLENNLGKTDNDFELIPINISVTNNQLQNLITPYNDLVLERKKILLTGGLSNPLLQTNDQKLSSLKQSIRAAVDNLQHDLATQLNTLENQYQQGLSHLRSIPGEERTLLDKTRQKEFTEKLYLYLLEKKEETALTLISSSPNFSLVDAPRSSEDAVSPNKKLFYLGGAFAGLGFPFLLILIFTLFKDSIQTKEELKEIMPDQPIAASILARKGKAQQQILLTEDFSALRMEIQLSQHERSTDILVTSSVAGEGKTFVATQLAYNFAKAKKKTVVVDFDLRKPTVSKYLVGKDYDKGLSNYLKGDCSFGRIIQSVKGCPDLYFIPGGPVLANPMGLISGNELHELFSFLKASYDVIIVDTPPIGIFSDALLLNNYLTTSLYVVRSGFTKRAMVEHAGEIFRQGKLINPSFVLNALPIGKIKYYKYYKYKSPLLHD